MPFEQSDTQPLWRSMLFVPTNVQKFVDSAPSRGADAYILKGGFDQSNLIDTIESLIG